MCVILSIVVVLLFLWDRGQATGFPGYQLKDMLIWGKGFVFVFLEKVIKVFTPSRVIWIRFDRGRPSEGLDFIEWNKKFILMILKFCFEIYILQNIQPWWISSSDMLNWPAWTPDVLVFHLDPVRTQTSETNTIIGVAFLRPTNSPISLPFPLPSKISQHPYSAWRSYEESSSQFPKLWGWGWLL